MVVCCCCRLLHACEKREVEKGGEKIEGKIKSMEGKDHVTQTGSSSLMFSFAPHTYSFQHTTLTLWVPGPSEVQLLTK